MRTTSSGVSTTGKRRDGRGLPISEAQGRSVRLAVEEQQGRQCLTMRGDRNLALVLSQDQKCLDFAAAGLPGDARGNG